MRLDRFLHDLGLGSRKDLKSVIRRGRIRVGDKIVRDPSYTVTAESVVYLDDNRVTYDALRYLLMNKPAGVISAREDKNDQTVVDLLSDELKRIGVVPVGRLDKDTTGLLILTNDGQLIHRLQHPASRVSKCYLVDYSGCLVENAQEQFSQGIDLGDFVSAEAELILYGEGKAEVILYEGKFHQVKRMIQAVGGEVTALKRVRIGSLTLPEDLPLGKWRFLTDDEVLALRQACGDA